MVKKFIKIILVLFILFWNNVASAQERFPRPEFQTDYVYPEHQMPLHRSQTWEYIDVGVLIAALLVTSWLAIKKRSRKGS